MPYGYFTIEQWRGKRWVAVGHVDGCESLTDAIREVEQRNKPGLFRVVQIQRLIWAEKTSGKLRLRKWHAGSPEAVKRAARAFDRDGGRWPQFSS